ncbi:hypothetical protein LINPERPRIM_LOCUS20493 [Linum perenne]
MQNFNYDNISCILVTLQRAWIIFYPDFYRFQAIKSCYNRVHESGRIDHAFNTEGGVKIITRSSSSPHTSKIETRGESFPCFQGTRRRPADFSRSPQFCSDSTSTSPFPFLILFCRPDW